MSTYFPHRSTGIMRMNMNQGSKHFDPWWALLECDEGIIAYYNWFLKKRGEGAMINKLWGPHISVIKGDEPNNKVLWNELEGAEVNFHYSNIIRMDNNKHAWLDVFSPELGQIRCQLGLSDRTNYHITIGRLK